MTNLEIKKEILQRTKRIENFEIRVILWHGDDIEIEDAIYNEVLIFVDNKLLELENTLYCSDTLEENDKNLKILKRQQQATFKYLKNNFDNVSKEECNV